MRLTLPLLTLAAFMTLMVSTKGGPQAPDPDLAKTWPTFYDGALQGTKHLCVVVSAVKPPPKNPPNPGFYSLRFRLYASEKAITRIDLDRTNLWKATIGPSDYLGGASGKVSVGKHDLSFSVNRPVSSVRLQLIMQSNQVTGEDVANVKDCTSSR